MHVPNNKPTLHSVAGLRLYMKCGRETLLMVGLSRPIAFDRPSVWRGNSNAGMRSLECYPRMQSFICPALSEGLLREIFKGSASSRGDEQYHDLSVAILCCTSGTHGNFHGTRS